MNKTEIEIMIELRNELLRELIQKRLEIDSAHLWEPLKKQNELCAELMHIEEKISLLDRRIEGEKRLKELKNDTKR